MKKLGFGLMRMPENGTSEFNGVDIDAVIEMVDKYVEMGFTYFDTAYFYHGGVSERVFRKAVAERYSRDKYVVADKLPIYAIDDMEGNERIFAEQLEKCGVNYFDYYLLHAMNATTFAKCESIGTFDFLKQLKADGRAKNIGLSFHDSAEVLDEILTKHPEIEFVQLQINYMDWLDSDVDSKRCYDVAIKHNKNIIIMEPIKGGMLANVPENLAKMYSELDASKSIASWAVRYCAGLDNVFMVLSGMSNMDQLDDNMSYMANFIPLSLPELDCVESVAFELKKLIAIQCTKCKYCVDDCPSKINIPAIFEIYNNDARYGGDTARYIGKYNEVTSNGGLASSCIGCGNCQSRCPQNLSIIENLAKIAEKYE